MSIAIQSPQTLNLADVAEYQRETNSQILAALALMVDIMQQMDPKISGSPNVVMLKEILKQVPGKPPPGCGGLGGGFIEELKGKFSSGELSGELDEFFNALV